MTVAILFPYHPLTGLRLERTLDYVPAAVPRDIYKENGELIFGEADESKVDWNAAECQALHGAEFLADSRGNECLPNEAVWSEADESHIAVEGGTSCTTVITPNGLREALRELASAAREVVLDSESGVDTKASCNALKALLQSHGLWEDFQPDEA